jgi:hypothetical protein
VPECGRFRAHDPALGGTPTTARCKHRNVAMHGVDPIWSNDLDAATWVRERLGSFGSGVGSIVPRGFEAYACVLHPFRDSEGQVQRWSTVVRQLKDGFTPIPTIASIILEASSKPGDPFGDYVWPEEGALDLEEAEVLVRVLRRSTTTAEQCWFCIWNGYADLNGSVIQLSVPGGAQRLPPAVPLSVLHGPLVELPNREYWLFEGPVEQAVATTLTTEHRHTPNLWWPEDRAWCVASEIDLSWSYVGGSRELIDELLSCAELEVVHSSDRDETVLPAGE